MCILFLAVQEHPDYPLIICANRDEFHQRATKSAHFWPQNPNMLAGQDLQEGGSWLGINKKGFFAAITNIRTGSKVSPDKQSRGELVTMALAETSQINHQWLQAHCQQYNPFNLVYGPLNELRCFNSTTGVETVLSKGFHAISNGSLDDVWPKMAKGEQQLEALVKSNKKVKAKKLLMILKDQSRPEAHQLPDTGIPLQWELLLSSIFIASPDYGTRSSSIILQKKQGSIKFHEVEYDRKGEELNHRVFKT